MRGRVALLGAVLVAAVATGITLGFRGREARSPAVEGDVERTDGGRRDGAGLASGGPDGEADPEDGRDGPGLAPSPGAAPAPAERQQPRGEARLEGRVTDARDRAVAGATVEARALPPPTDAIVPPLTTTTDAEGRFGFGGLAAGSWAVLARHAGFAGATPVVVTTGTTDARLALGTLGWIEGTVRRADGEALAGAWEVVVTPVGGDAPGLALAVRDGRFESPGLVATTFRVTLRAAGAAAEATPTADALVTTAPQTVAVADGQGTRVDLVLQRGAVLRGRVEEAGTGAAVAGAVLQATLDGAPSTGGRTAATTKSAADGTWELAGLASGHWVVVVTSEEYATRRERATLGPEAAETRAISVAKWATVTVTVVDEAGKPVFAAKVHAQSEDGAGVAGDDAGGAADDAGSRTFPTDGSGRHVLRVGPGTWSVGARTDDPPRVGAPERVTVEAGGSAEVKVTLRPRRAPPARDR
ncbi:MAG: carboxypeptidase-like regulatory domain-containing protein [Planctomycetota bacterium]